LLLLALPLVLVVLSWRLVLEHHLVPLGQLVLLGVLPALPCSLRLLIHALALLLVLPVGLELTQRCWLAAVALRQLLV
jgi:hypothetical protein